MTSLLVEASYRKWIGTSCFSSGICIWMTQNWPDFWPQIWLSSRRDNIWPGWRTEGFLHFWNHWHGKLFGKIIEKFTSILEALLFFLKETEIHFARKLGVGKENHHPILVVFFKVFWNFHQFSHEIGGHDSQFDGWAYFFKRVAKKNNVNLRILQHTTPPNQQLMMEFLHLEVKWDAGLGMLQGSGCAALRRDVLVVIWMNCWRGVVCRSVWLIKGGCVILRLFPQR